MKEKIYLNFIKIQEIFQQKIIDNRKIPYQSVYSDS